MLAVSARATQRARVLLGGEDPDRSGRLASALAAHGVVPSLAFGARQLVEFLDSEHFDLVVVDLDPARGARDPSVSDDASVRILITIAERSDAPVVALGGSGTVALELVGRGVLSLPRDGGVPETARALFGLVVAHNGTDLPRFVHHGPLELDIDHRLARWHGETIDLTKLQFRLLVALATAEGALVSRADLHRALYGTAPIDDGERVVAHVRRIREKIEAEPSHPEFLLTVRGEGFRLADTF
jgi:two-component system, OmpR family, response regulator MtrA